MLGPCVLLRDAGTPLGQQASVFIKKGELVPDSVTCGLMLDSLLSSKSPNVLLDGFPRTHGQAVVVDKATSIDMVLHLDVPGAWCLSMRLRACEAASYSQLVCMRACAGFSGSVICRECNLFPVVRS